MKFSLALVAIAAVATLAVEAAPTEPVKPSSAWCSSFADACREVALAECTGNNQSKYSCSSEFAGETCSAYSVICQCMPTGGAVKNITKQTLQATFSRTGGKCSDLPPGPGPVSPPGDNTPSNPPPGATSAVANPPVSSTSTAAAGSSTTSSATAPTNTAGSNNKSAASASQVAVLSTVALSAAISLVMNML